VSHGRSPRVVVG